MRQVLQSLRTGEIELVEAPAPSVRPLHVLIESRKTLISAGTERMLLEFGRGNLVQKALQQPEKVRQTLQKVRTDGLSATIDAVRSKLDQPIPLGYCSAGVVREVGRHVSHVKPGDRVVSNGPHAELSVVGRNLVAKIPDSVSDEEAAFTPLAAIALQGLRLAQPSLGETFVVQGLGLIGLITVQLLRAHGCKVIGVDFSKERLSMAERWGATTVDLSQGADPVAAGLAATGGTGVDGVIIAAATKGDEVIAQAAQMSRKRGRIILVGVVGLNLSRADFYEKELSFQVSCSYGPGRYDPAYEVEGADYPVGFVRWTEQRNFEAVLAEMAERRLLVRDLISEIIDIEQVGDAYNRLDANGGDLGLMLSYPSDRDMKFERNVALADGDKHGPSAGVVALIGAGGFGGRITAPGLKAAGARLKTMVSRGGVSSVVEGRKAGFEQASTDTGSVFQDREIDTVVIATRHDSHAELTLEALESGKNVYVEKPLALTAQEIDRIETAYQEASECAPRIMVGFNRRFSPFSIKMKSLLDAISEPKCLTATINAGAIPSSHWIQDPLEGGGRIIGEACHFIDLMRFFVGEPITDLTATTVGKPTSDGLASDKATLTMSFKDGSIATVHYFANGPQSLSKERYEAFAGGKWLMLDNFKKLSGLGWKNFTSMSGKQDKGQAAALTAFISSIQSGTASPIPADEILEVSRWAIKAADNSGMR